MTHPYKRSNSVTYIISKWFNEILLTQNDYNKNIQLIFQSFKVPILNTLIDMQKLVEKNTEKELFQKKFEMIEKVAQIEQKIIIFDEFLMSYIVLIDGIQTQKLDLKSPSKLISLIKNDHDFLKTMQITLRNIAKLMGLVSKSELKNFKKFEENFDFQIKEYQHLIKKLDKDSVTSTDQFNLILVELNNEVENVKKIEQAKETNPTIQT